MKRRALLIVALAALPALVFGIPLPTEISSITWNDARSAGMGGTSLLFSTGYDSFFGNPAGYAGKGSLTLADASMWGYLPFNPGQLENLDSVFMGTADSYQRDEYLDAILASNGQIGGGMSMGLGWAGKGFALGANMISDAALGGYDYANSSLVLKNQFNAVVGFGLPLRLGFIDLAFGADIRGFYRFDSFPEEWSAYALMNAFFGYTNDFDALLSSKTVLAGLGYAVDAGMTLKVGPLMAGVMARDLFASLQADIVSMQEISESAAFPTTGGYEIAVLPTITAGLGLRLNESGLVAPSLYVQTDDAEGLLASLSTIDDVDVLLESVQAGAELRLLRIFLLRGGLNHNLLSLGAGIDLAIIRADLALFMSPFEGLDTGVSGIAVRGAVKL